jgi:hypothetical protein
MEASQAHGRLLGEILVEDGLITPDQLAEALSAQAETGKRLGEVLIERELISGPELKSALLAQFGVEPESETGYGTGLWKAIRRRQGKPRTDVETTADANYIRLAVTQGPPSPTADGTEHVVVEETLHALPRGSAVGEPGDQAEASGAFPDEHVDNVEGADHREDEKESAPEAEQSGVEAVSSERAAPQPVEPGVESEVLRPYFDGAPIVLAQERTASASVVEALQPVTRPGSGTDYLLFAPGPTGYKLSHRTGAPPELGAVTELNGVAFQVVKIGCSPLPADGRQCVYLAA